MGDLLGLLAEPIDRSFESAGQREPRIVVGEPCSSPRICGSNTAARITSGKTRAQRALELDPPRRDDRRGGPIRLRQDDMAPHPHAPGAPERRRGDPGRCRLSCISRQVIGELVGYVGQNPFVFAGTVAENIAYGCEAATHEQIRRAAERACIHDEIMALPGGYDAPVAERGQNLSGGQKQRIALARVFLKNPPILILDEGTSALDNISERLVQRAITAAGPTARSSWWPTGSARSAKPIASSSSMTADRRDRHLFRACAPGGVFAELVRSAEEVDAGTDTRCASDKSPSTDELEDLATENVRRRCMCLRHCLDESVHGSPRVDAASVKDSQTNPWRCTVGLGRAGVTQMGGSASESCLFYLLKLLRRA